LLGFLFLNFWRGVARNPDGTPMFVVNFEPMLFVYAAWIAAEIALLDPRWILAVSHPM